MEEIKFRIAKPSDAKQIANLHWHVRDRYDKGIFLSLGKGFLRKYWKILLNDPWEVIICAVNENGNIVGFNSTTMDAAEEAKNLRKHKFTLALHALKAILIKPSLFKEVWSRYKSLSPKNIGIKFIHTEGARGGYWCWDKNDESLKSFELTKVKNGILKLLGLKEFYFEVDKFNKPVYNFHLKVNKAEPIEEIKLPDGRQRILLKKQL